MPAAAVAIDWKATGYLAGGVVATLSLIKRILTPFAVSQVRDAMEPLFDAQNKTLGEIQDAQVEAERRVAALSERVAKIEGRLAAS